MNVRFLNTEVTCQTFDQISLFELSSAQTCLMETELSFLERV